jgi:hypothetical protein
MKFLIAIALLLMLVSDAEAQPAPAASEVILKMLEGDFFGMGNAEVTARVTLTDKQGAASVLNFVSHATRYAPLLSKSIVRFSAPPDLQGAGFLQIQKQDGDDERHLFLPEIKKSRQISGSLRSTAFMGTDFSYADLDQRDIRTGAATFLNEETIGKYPCYHIQIIPKPGTSQYSRIVVWIRKDNFASLKTELYDHSNVLLKIMTTKELKRIGERWFISKLMLVNQRESHTTELVLETIVPRTDYPEDEFTIRNLERL